MKKESDVTKTFNQVRSLAPRRFLMAILKSIFMWMTLDYQFFHLWLFDHH